MPTTTICRAKNPATCRIHGTLTFPQHKGTFEDHLRESNKFRMFLSDEEQEAFQSYVETGYGEVNECLYGLTALDEEIEEIINHLKRGLDKYKQLQSGEEQTTFRATKAYKDFTSKEEAEEWFEENFPINGTVKFAGFTSTTANVDSLFSFLPTALEDEEPPIGDEPWEFPTMKEYNQWLEETPNPGLGNIIFIMKSKSGVPMSSFEHAYSVMEQEYLHSPDLEYRVEEVIPYRKVESATYGPRIAHATVITLKEV